LGLRDQEMLKDFIGHQAASFGQANGIFGSLQQFLFFEVRDYGLQWNQRGMTELFCNAGQVHSTVQA